MYECVSPPPSFHLKWPLVSMLQMGFPLCLSQPWPRWSSQFNTLFSGK